MNLIGLLIFACHVAFIQSIDKKEVQTSLKANWDSTSLLAEASEFIAEENEKQFFKFVDIVNSEASTLDWEQLTDEQKYEYTMKTAAKVISPASMDLLKFALALRQYSPRVQSFQQIAAEYGENCPVFAVVGEQVSCELSKVDSLIKDAKKDTQVLASDHIIGNKSSKKAVIVYGELGSASFAKAWQQLSQTQKNGLIFRHFQKTIKSNPVSLSGYGVELAIKNTEYKAVDESNEKKSVEEDETDLFGFNIKLLKELHPESVEAIETFRVNLKESDELTPLKRWELQDLSYQAAQKIVNAGPAEALGTLEEYSQNFPTHARALAKTTVSDKLRKEVLINRKMLEESSIDVGETSLYINGINQDINSLDLFKLASLLKQENKLAEGFHSMGINREYLSVLVGMDTSDEEKTSYAVDHREGYPFFINNLDTDKKYKQWGNSVKLMLQPYYPGMIRPIARNLFSLVFVVDPSTAEGRKFLRIGQTFNSHDIAMRIGYIFVVNQDPKASGETDLGIALLNLFNFVSIDSTNADALKVLNNFLDSYRSQDPTIADLKEFFEGKFSDANFKEVFGVDSDYDKGRKHGFEFVQKTGLNSAPKVLLNGFILDDEGVRGDNIEETIMMEVMKISPKIQRAIMEGKLTDRMNVGNWVLDQKDVMPRINKRILSAPSKKIYVDLLGSKECKTLEGADKLSEVDKAACILQTTKYLQKATNDAILPVTFWTVADAESVDGRRFIYNSLQVLKNSGKTRVGIIFNPENIEKACEPNSISSYIRAALEYLPMDQAKRLILKLSNEEYAVDFVSGKMTFDDLSVGGMDTAKFLADKKKLDCGRTRAEANLIKSLLDISAGDRVVVGNALQVGPLDKDEHFEAADFKLLESMLLSRGADVIASHLTKWEYNAANGAGSNVAFSIAGLVGRHASSQKRTWVSIKGDEHSVVTLPADEVNRPAVDVLAVVDPLTLEAQKLGTILQLIKKVTNCDIKLIMNPKDKHSELPLKRFYRYAAASELSFDSNGNLNSNVVRFDNLPSKQLLTMSLQAPDSWIVEAVSAKYDLDNIKLEQASGNVVAVFALQHLLVEGQCFDEVSGQPPRGLQFVLGTDKNPKQFDTIVMANLGYFQLKANPGAWKLEIREGKSSEIYKIGSHVGAEKIGDDVLQVVIDSFTGKSVRVRVEKKEGMEDRNVLSDEEEGVWSSLSNLVSSKEKPQEVINVFSLASGHLYERFMRIMIVSVMKNTKHPVKFWLLKNYLSPQFKETLPTLAKHYGFEYELIEYKWPRWLHQQKEKQRIMWGFKILFLDVLFPLDVQKVIFVDADQVVRADLMELMKFDLGNAPYGYVPFCESRKEMDGFRFWKQGYWANHLAGRRYHISALYVIDLQKFRQIAAGDRLRGQYQGLSGDPNSLANLDQDLPNNMIHQVKIKSLPQEWLWCETWCDDASKKNAKTIDLCNNPLTKEPKLDSATRIIGEWKTYDDEIREVISGKNGESNVIPDIDDSHTEL
uniref:UDP-glucose:glycoprotein glucosyltransferase n=1 Tax=Caenorhabditis tropicalis TaxID=1561998 RepID=A0A1I7TWE2_9PELO